jgi:hypothetical protein
MSIVIGKVGTFGYNHMTAWRSQGIKIYIPSLTLRALDKEPIPA